MIREGRGGIFSAATIISAQAWAGEVLCENRGAKMPLISAAGKAGVYTPLGGGGAGLGRSAGTAGVYTPDFW